MAVGVFRADSLAYPQFYASQVGNCRSQSPSRLRRGSTADRLLGLRVRIPPGAWTSVCFECCVLSGRDLYDGPIPRPEESYRLWSVIVCDEMNNNPLHLDRGWTKKERKIGNWLATFRDN
jgi:hypothetical protein